MPLKFPTRLAINYVRRAAFSATVPVVKKSGSSIFQRLSSFLVGLGLGFSFSFYMVVEVKLLLEITYDIYYVLFISDNFSGA